MNSQKRHHPSVWCWHILQLVFVCQSLAIDIILVEMAHNLTFRYRMRFSREDNYSRICNIPDVKLQMRYNFEHGYSSHLHTTLVTQRVYVTTRDVVMLLSDVGRTRLLLV